MLKELFVKRGSDFAGRPTEDTYMRLKLIYPEGNKGKNFSLNYIVKGNEHGQKDTSFNFDMVLLEGVGVQPIQCR